MHSPPGDSARRAAAPHTASCLACAVTLAGIALLSAGLSGCGQKGPLYLPSTQKSTVPAAPGSAPASNQKAPNTQPQSAPPPVAASPNDS